MREAATDTAAAWVSSLRLARLVASLSRKRLELAGINGFASRRNESIFDFLIACVVITWAVYGRHSKK